MDAAIAILAGPASLGLGAKVCEALAATPVAYEARRFPDGETQVELGESVRGRDVFLIQATSPPADIHLIEFLLLADACRRDGAERLTGIIPYLGYARQDRRGGRRSLGARVVADVIGTSRVDRLVLVNAHTPAIEGFFACPIEHLTAVPLLASAIQPRDNSILVAPDLGAVKLAREYARLLNIPIAVVHKTRVDGRSVQANEIVGEVHGRAPIVVDDILSTGATVEAALTAVRAAGAVHPATAVVTHALLVGHAHEVLRSLEVAAVTATDSVALDAPADVQIQQVSLAPLLAEAIRRLRGGSRQGGQR